MHPLPPVEVALWIGVRPARSPVVWYRVCGLQKGGPTRPLLLPGEGPQALGSGSCMVFSSHDSFALRWSSLPLVLYFTTALGPYFAHWRPLRGAAPHSRRWGCTFGFAVLCGGRR